MKNEHLDAQPPRAVAARTGDEGREGSGGRRRGKRDVPNDERRRSKKRRALVADSAAGIAVSSPSLGEDIDIVPAS